MLGVNWPPYTRNSRYFSPDAKLIVTLLGGVMVYAKFHFPPTLRDYVHPHIHKKFQMHGKTFIIATPIMAHGASNDEVHIH